MRVLLPLCLLASCQEYKISQVPTDDSDSLPTLPTDVPPPTPIPTTPPTEPVDYDAPVVTCDASQYIVAPPYDSVNLLGDATDPQGLQITSWAWTVVGPGGSDAVPTPANTQDSSLTPDLAGVYNVSLVATNSAGVASAPCNVQIESISAQDLRVEMFWDQNGDDMDLHLLAPGGTFESSTTDCHFTNCKASSIGLDWGTLGFTDDDPVLDLDDISGDGPENINIIQPQNGSYTVIVHDYGADPGIPSTSVTVNIYLDGALVWTDTRSITGDDSETHFARIDWSTRSVVGL